MKVNFKFYFFVFLYLFLGNSLFAQDCKKDLINCANEEKLSIVFNLAGYTNSSCTILVTYKRRVCNGIYNLYDFVYVPLGNCSDFKTRMMGDPDFARDVDVFAARQISNITAKKVIFDSGGNPEQYNCDANPIKTVQVSYVRGSCIAIWSGKTTVQIPVPGTQKEVLISGEPGGLSYITILEFTIPIDEEVLATVACGDGCCKLTRTYCNDNGKISAKEEATSSNPTGEVCSFVVPDPPFFFEQEVTWLSSSPCFTPCNNLPSGNKMTTNSTVKTTQIMKFKNPTDGDLEVLFAKEVEGIIEVVAIDGKVIKKVKLVRENSIFMDLTTIPVGVYSIQLTQNNGQVEIQKLINQ